MHIPSFRTPIHPGNLADVVVFFCFSLSSAFLCYVFFIYGLEKGFRWSRSARAFQLLLDHDTKTQMERTDRQTDRERVSGSERECERERQMAVFAMHILEFCQRPSPFCPLLCHNSFDLFVVLLFSQHCNLKYSMPLVI